MELRRGRYIAFATTAERATLHSFSSFQIYVFGDHVTIMCEMPRRSWAVCDRGPKLRVRGLPKNRLERRAMAGQDRQQAGHFFGGAAAGAVAGSDLRTTIRSRFDFGLRPREMLTADPLPSLLSIWFVYLVTAAGSDLSLLMLLADTALATLLAKLTNSVISAKKLLKSNGIDAFFTLL